jgi:prophage tail gpP-like protein
MKLEVGNVIYSGFNEVYLRSSMDCLFDEFRITCANRFVDDKAIKLGSDCRILSPDDEILLDGYIYSLTAPIGGVLTLSGMDKTADLAACTIDGTGEFRGLTVAQIIERVCSPFGITVSGDAPASLEVFRYGLNEKAIDVIRELCARHGLLANSDGGGNIVLTRATQFDRAELQLEEGNNITGGSLTVSENRYSAVKMLGQNRGAAVSGSATGTASRSRPLTAVQTGNLSAGQAVTGAQWLAAVSSAEAYSVSVAGMYNVRPNTLIDIQSRSLGVSGSLLIRAVTWIATGGELTTQFDLVNPAMYGGENVKNGWIR